MDGTYYKLMIMIYCVVIWRGFVKFACLIFKVFINFVDQIVLFQKIISPAHKTMLFLVTMAFLLAAAHASSFIGAVVEFSPSFPDFGHDYTREEAVSAMMINIKRLDTFAAQAAAQGAQIIVFPEYGITADEPFSNWTRVSGPGSIVPFTEPIPGMPKWGVLYLQLSLTFKPTLVTSVSFSALHTNPCLSPDHFPQAAITLALSCMAQKHNMTIVADYGDLITCPPNTPPCRADGMAMFNTAVAFSNDGTLIGRYHKHHLFEEPYYDVDVNQTRATFVTSFGVEFGMFICFDIIFEILPWPSTVTHFVFPTEWSNTFLPGLTAQAAQSQWSKWHGAVLLASNVGQNTNISGSGIWDKGQALASWFNPTKSPQDKLLVAIVPA
jgi:predicted amidohydrolase